MTTVLSGLRLDLCLSGFSSILWMERLQGGGRSHRSWGKSSILWQIWYADLVCRYDEILTVAFRFPLVWHRPRQPSPSESAQMSTTSS